jgi:hypothetical protein
MRRPVARRHELQYPGVRRREHALVLDSHGDEVADVEEPPVVDLRAGHPPVRQPVRLLIQQPVQRVEAARITLAPIVRLHGLVDTAADVAVIAVALPERVDGGPELIRRADRQPRQVPDDALHVGA